MEKNEIWMPVKGYEDLYEVSDFGRVRSLNYRGNTKKTVVLKAGNVRGYLRVLLCKNGNKKNHLVHRLVYEAFRGPIPSGLQINHFDEVKTNNCLDNLEICTPRENTNYGTRNERAGKANKKALLGNTCAIRKPVHQIDKKTGEVINTFPSCKEAQRQTGIKRPNIVKCCLSQRNSAGGFIWRYVDVNNKKLIQ